MRRAGRRTAPPAAPRSASSVGTGGSAGSGRTACWWSDCWTSDAMGRMSRTAWTALGAAAVLAVVIGLVAGLLSRASRDESGRRGATTRTPAPGAPRLEPVDGGPRYYARFAAPLPADPSYFPIAVWGQTITQPSDVESDRTAGINTYVEVA